MVPVFAAQYEATMAHGLPINVAPNILVSLVMLPWEARWLVAPSVRRRYALREAKMAAMRRVFGRGFDARLKRLDEQRHRSAAAG
jgi:hypothetical protein